MENKNLKKDIGIFIATALVAGNMMGSGIFMLPSSLAAVAGPGSTLLAWILTGIGSIFLALSFAKLGSKIPKTGGPYEYSKLAFGDFMGFINAWLYWNGCWIANAAVIITITSYSAVIFPILGVNHLYSFIFGSVILWLVTLLNIFGVKKAGQAQLAITIFEIILFIFFIIISSLHFNTSNIGPLFPAHKGIGTLSSAATLTLWAFIGLESASVNAGEIKNPEKNVKRSTIYGIVIAIILYLLINFFAMGAMPQAELAKSSSPIADILSKYLGSNVTKYITIAAVVSVLGTAVGWILSTARISFAAAQDKVFPEIFGKVHPRFKTPYMSLIIPAILVNILLLMNYTKSFTAAFNFIVILATLSYLPVYASTAAAEIMLLVKVDKKFNLFKFIKSSIIPLLGFIYAGWTIYGSGATTVLWGFILILAGVPFYLYMKLKNYDNITKLRKDNNLIDM
ncbi:amino acid permease [uncultured Clostridium sp.]|uniref:APC family permease n=1 Tax=uncultured Clostridium sp. TaxID=59620 RepID=UPI00261331AF|nr:amino acid permease [uncultured Clostridium sp.]